MKTTFSTAQSDALSTTISRHLLRCRTVTLGIADSEPYKSGRIWCIDVLPTIQQIVELDGERTYQDFPKLTGVPIVLPSSASTGLSMTVPIKSGDDVILLVSDRPIDNWELQKGPQRPADEAEIRHHDMTDCLCIPNALTVASLDTYNNDAIQIGTPTVNITVNGSDVNINANSVTVTAESNASISCSDATIDATSSASINASTTTITSATVTINGELVVTGTVTGAAVNAPAVAAGALSIGGVDLPSDHTHAAGSYSVMVNGNPVAVTGTSGAPQ